MPSHHGYQKVATSATLDNIHTNNSSDTNNSSELPAMESSRISEGLPSTHSSQQLMQPDTESVSTSLETRNTNLNNDNSTLSSISARDWCTVIVLCFINLINYMDRFTIAGVLSDIQADFKIGDDRAGLLQTAFILSYMVFAPLFGYLGDRHSRKWIMAFGVALWGVTTLLGSFMYDFGWFLTFRALVGIGEASYSTLAPTIISDLFISNVRSKMLALFYFAIPVGSGLGYIVGSETAKALGSWRWALRVTPVLGLVAVVLLVLIKEPQRGQCEGSHNMAVTSYKEDVKALAKNPSFILSTAGFTCVAFVAGALAFWGPKFIHLGLKLQPGNTDISLNDVSYKFGLLAMFAGLVGVPLGSYLATQLREKTPNCDPLICATGLLISSPCVYFAMILASKSTAWCFFFIFAAEITLNLCWSLIADMLLYVVVPTRRSTAEAFQILISHAFGDAGSPYLVGVISEAIKSSMRMAATSTVFSPDLTSLSQLAENATTTILPFVQEEDSTITQFKALQYSLFTTSFVEILGGVFFLITASYILRDKSNAERQIAESNESLPSNTSITDNTSIQEQQ